MTSERLVGLTPRATNQPTSEPGAEWDKVNSGVPYAMGARWFIACPICREWGQLRDTAREANEALDLHIGHEHSIDQEDQA